MPKAQVTAGSEVEEVRTDSHRQVGRLVRVASDSESEVGQKGQLRHASRHKCILEIAKWDYVRLDYDVIMIFSA